MEKSWTISFGSCVPSTGKACVVKNAVPTPAVRNLQLGECSVATHERHTSQVPFQERMLLGTPVSLGTALQ